MTTEEQQYWDCEDDYFRRCGNYDNFRLDFDPEYQREVAADMLAYEYCDYFYGMDDWIAESLA